MILTYRYLPCVPRFAVAEQIGITASLWAAYACRAIEANAGDVLILPGSTRAVRARL